MKTLVISFIAAAGLTGAASAQTPLSFRDVVSADGVPLAIAESSGAGKPQILMIHGVGQSMWSLLPALQSPLCERVKCVAFDMRGHGQSGKPWTAESYTETKRWADDVTSVMKAAGLEKPVVLGWSYGTIVIGDYVRHYGVKDVSGIVFVGGNGFMATPTIQPTPDQLASMQRRTAAWSGGDPDAQLNAALEVVSFYTDKPQDAAWSLKAAMLNMQLPPYVRRALNQRRISNADLAPEFQKTPFLYVTGEKDAGVFAAIEGMKKLAPNIEVVTYPDVGHAPFVEAREPFLKDISAFVEKVGKK
jgi:pimeloyl-ACP methyl ester carboxylesterase